MSTYYIGYDVGAWSCKNSKSCDAIVILNAKNEIIGCPWRGNLKQQINDSVNALEFIESLFGLCKAASSFEKDISVIFAIDTPLGYSAELVKLITEYHSLLSVGSYETNPYLFRATERFIYTKRIQNADGKLIKPLSAVNNMIGSQSTKGIHIISKFAPEIAETGVWKNSTGKLTIIETYPSLLKANKLIDGLPNFDNADKADAYLCALLAKIFLNERSSRLFESSEWEMLHGKICQKEGWIWFLKK